ncbi:unnamed protein product, partial [Iphiclides podalirius]
MVDRIGPVGDRDAATDTAFGRGGRTAETLAPTAAGDENALGIQMSRGDNALESRDGQQPHRRSAVSVSPGFSRLNCAPIKSDYCSERQKPLRSGPSRTV